VKRKNAPATLRDIAEEVGVTPSTVSAVLNNAPKSLRYTEATKTRIREAAQRLGYTSNPLAQALRGQPPQLLGFISFNVDSTYYGHILNAIEHAAQERGYQVVMANMQRNRDRLEPCIQLMLRWRVRGVLLGTIGNAMGEPLQRVVRTLPVPLVNLGAPEPDAPVCCINFDNAAAGKCLADHLLALGHRRAVMLTGSTRLGYFDDRCRSFKHYFESGTEFARGHVEIIEVPPPGDFDAAYRATVSLLQRNRDFTALAGGNDALAIGAMRALLDHGVQVPDQVSVAGVDDISLASGGGNGARVANYLKPSLTTVRVPVADIARAGVFQLLRIIDSEEASGSGAIPDSFLLPPELIPRESTARLRQPLPHHMA